MKQKRIESLPGLIAAGTKASGGADDFGAAIGLTFGSKANIDADLAALITARDNYDSGKLDLTIKRMALKAAVSAAVTFVTAARDALKLTFGTQPSPVWVGTGFDQKFRVPTTADGVRERARLLKTLFTNRPELEVVSLNLTAARAETIVNGITTAQNAVNAQKTAAGTLLDLRLAKETALRNRLSGLTEELGRLIDPLDQRWTSFGLNKPGAKETPNVPENVTVTLIGGGKAVVSWGASPRAEHYRLWMKINGVDEEMLSVGSSAGVDFTIEGLPANATIEIAVSAVNNGGESGKSAVVTVSTH